MCRAIYMWAGGILSYGDTVDAGRRGHVAMVVLECCHLELDVFLFFYTLIWNQLAGAGAHSSYAFLDLLQTCRLQPLLPMHRGYRRERLFQVQDSSVGCCLVRTRRS